MSFRALRVCCGGSCSCREIRAFGSFDRQSQVYIVSGRFRMQDRLDGIESQPAADPSGEGIRQTVFVHSLHHFITMIFAEPGSSHHKNSSGNEQEENDQD